VYEGWKVPIDYDPLLAKLIGHGTDRSQAMSRLARALNEYFVGGIKTNLPLLRRILGQSDFQAGDVDTGYLDRLLKSETAEAKGHENVAAIAVGLFAMLERSSTVANDGQGASTWKKAARADALRGIA
jgi:acetyl-CoA carboxylase biotin carboxylase subunit